MNTTWEHFERTKEKLAIVGFSINSRSLAPYDNPDYEIWGLNEEHSMEWMKRYDRWFQLHPKYDYMRHTNSNDYNHSLWLKNVSGQCLRCKGTMKATDPTNGKEIVCPSCVEGIYTPPPEREGVPIYLQKEDEEVPNCVRYPLAEIMKALFPFTDKPYFTSSPAYMLAMAIWMGYDRIELYGFEMGTMTEYHYQRANFEYLIGMARGMGIDVLIPASQICTGKLYGYDNMSVGFRQDLEIRNKFLEMRIIDTEKEVHMASGRFSMIKKIMEKPEWTDEEMKALMEEEKKKFKEWLGLLNFKKGAAQEIGQMTKVYDAYFRPENSNEELSKEDMDKLIRLDYTMEGLENGSEEEV